MEDHGQLMLSNVNLPPKIVYEIFSRLSVKPLCRFKCVSRRCRSLISDPDFVAKYNKVVKRRLLLTCFGGFRGQQLLSLNVDKFLRKNHNADVGGLVARFTELDFVYNHLPELGLDWFPFVQYSCHGLVLSRLCFGDLSYILINPVTKESQELQKPPIWRLPLKACVKDLYGLGFDHSNNNYKVINGQVYDDGIVFSVYTLQTGSWRQIDYLFPYKPVGYDAIVVNGAVHWLMRKIADRSLVIVSFTLTKEELSEIPVPPILSTLSIKLGSFRTWLCITMVSKPFSKKKKKNKRMVSKRTEEATYNEFWIMKEYGESESWTKMHVSIPYKNLSHSGIWTETYDLMVCDRSSLVMYNFSDDKFWNLPIRMDEVGRFGSVGIYVESLPSQASLTDQEQRKRRKLRR